MLTDTSYYGDSGYPYQPVFVMGPIKTQCGFKIVNIRKRKLGVVTTIMDTILVRPNAETLLEIQW